MASVEAGASALTGPTTSQVTPAGAGSSPTSGHAYSESILYSNNPNAGEYGSTSLSSVSSIQPGQSPGTVSYFRMRGQDQNIGGRYDSWTVVNAPDFTGSQYTGPLSTPLRDVTITASWRR